MNSCRVHSLGKDFALTIDSVTIPEPTEILAVIKVAYAAINPVDFKVCKGYLPWPTSTPHTVGYDFSGKIVALPSGAENTFSIGDSVCAVNWGKGSHAPVTDAETCGGAFAQYIAVPVSKLSKVPEGVKMDVAAALQLTGTTAYQSLFQCGQLTAGQKVLILGGASAVGQLAIQLANLKGCTVFTTASTRNIKFVSQFNPFKIINYLEDDWAAMEELKGIDLVFDTVGVSGDFDRAKKILKADGRWVTIANFEAGFDPSAHQPLQFAAFHCLNNEPAVADHLLGLVAEGKLMIHIDETFPFTAEGCVGIFDKISSNKSCGKNLLKVEA